MRKAHVEYYKVGFENNVAGWRSFGEALQDDNWPNSRRRSTIIRKVLCGDWQEAYGDWLKLGDFWTEEEVFLGFILACEAIIHGRPPAPVPELPVRVWDDAEYRRWLRHYDDDEFWFHISDRLTTPGTTTWLEQRNEFIKLLGAGKAEEAETFYRSLGWDQFQFAESDLALIHMCSFVLGD